MINAIRYTPLVVLLGLTAQACASSVVSIPKVSHYKQAAGFELALVDKDGHCQLEVSKAGRDLQMLTLKLLALCGFHPTPEGKVRVTEFNDQTYILLEFSRVIDSKNCDTRLQAVRLVNNRVEA